MESDSVFSLDGAYWPALLVDSACAICRANQAALRMFPSLSQPSASLAAIWSAENGMTAEQFLANCEKSSAPAAAVKLENKPGTTMVCTALICSVPPTEQGRRFFVFQLIPQSEKDSQAATETNQTLKQKLDFALQLARSVASDFNNALTGVMGHASHLLVQMKDCDPWRGSMKEIERSAVRAAEIASDLSAFSRQEKKKTAGGPSGNLNTPLQRAIDTLRQTAAGAGTKWSVELERGLFFVKIDEGKVQQSFSRVLENAVEAVAAGGRISVQTRNLELQQATQDRNARLQPGAYVCVEITDDGHGIAPEALPRVFEPFFTTKGGSHQGLGLAMVYGVLTNGGGSMAISSQPGTGTSVRMYFPAEKRVAGDPEYTDAELQGRETILLVDDEELILTMSSTVLEAYGYKALKAANAQAGLDILARAKQPVDLVITDMIMPVMNGRELVDRIRARNPEQRILCTSGYVRSSAQWPESVYLQKPFTARQLLIKVRQVLGSPANEN